MVLYIRGNSGSWDSVDAILNLFSGLTFGGLAQLARAPALHAGGHRFDSDILHDECFKKRNRKEQNVKSLLFEVL